LETRRLHHSRKGLWCERKEKKVHLTIREEGQFITIQEGMKKPFKEEARLDLGGGEALSLGRGERSGGGGRALRRKAAACAARGGERFGEV